MPQEFYSEEEAKEILNMASREGRSNISRQDLFQMANELGISPEEVIKAEENFREVQRDSELRAQYRSQIKTAYMQQLIAWAVIILFFAMVWAIFGRGFFWPIFPIIALGIGLPISLVEMKKDLGIRFESKYSKWKLKQDAKLVAKNAINKVINRLSKL